jgi:hypothetical protein
MVTVGGPTTRVVVVDGRVENREYLPLTLSFDHSGDRRSTCRSFRQQVPESARNRSRRARRETPHPTHWLTDPVLCLIDLFVGDCPYSPIAGRR